MRRERKVKTVDDIVNHYQEFHHQKGKKFEERMKAFEEFNDPENIHAAQLGMHAHYTVFGHPNDEKNFPGAYRVAFKELDKAVKEDDEKVDQEDVLAKILETYVDTFLTTALGDSYKRFIDHAKTKAKNKGKKLEDKDVRELKGMLMSEYVPAGERGGLNILSEQYIKGLKGKKKIELIRNLQNISETVREAYTGELAQKALAGIFDEHNDRVPMAEYLDKKFEERGWKHDKSHIFRPVGEQANHYNLLLGGVSDQLKKAGYKPVGRGGGNAEHAGHGGGRH